MKKKEIIIYIVIGFIAGLINGILGSGGGIILVLGYEFLLKKSAKNSQATSMLIIFPISIVTIIIYSKSINIDINLLVYILLGTLVGCIIGSKLLFRLKNKYVHIIFGTMLIVSGISMVVK